MVTVNNGDGDGQFEPGEIVEIYSDSPGDSREFVGWTITSGNVELEDASERFTSFGMPDEDVVVTAVYKENHTHQLTLVPAKEPTCTEDGNKEYYVCNGCEKWFEDEEGTVEILDKDSVIIPAKGHNYEDGACTVCGELDPKYSIGDVDMDGTVTIKDATLIQMYVSKVKFDSVFSKALADVNRDNKITVYDATLIQVAIAKRESE